MDRQTESIPKWDIGYHKTPRSSMLKAQNGPTNRFEGENNVVSCLFTTIKDYQFGGKPA
jgi:hypothetical protein